MNKFTRKPKSHANPNSEDALASFIEGASCHTNTVGTPCIQTPSYPWNEPFLQKQYFTRGVSFRLSEVELRKLKYLSEQTRISQAKLVSQALERLFDVEFPKLGVDHHR